MQITTSLHTVRRCHRTGHLIEDTYRVRYGKDGRKWIVDVLDRSGKHVTEHYEYDKYQDMRTYLQTLGFQPAQIRV